MTTRATNSAIMDHVIQTVLGQPSDGPLALALRHGGYDLVEDVLIMSNTDIDALEYPVTDDKDGTRLVPLIPARRNLVRAFQAYIRYLRQTGTFATYISITNFGFNEFRISEHYDPNSPSTPSPAVSSTRSTSRTTIADDFRKGIKREKSHYSVLREEKQWDGWRRSTLATARSHGCEDVFDRTYQPTTAEERDVFNEKQKFIYSVFEEKLQTDMGKSIVRDHEHDFDAQTIYAQLLDHANASTQASIDTADLLKYITTVQLHESRWRGTSHSFILHWCDKVREYEGLVPKADHFTDNVKMIMLQNTVSGVSALHHVKTQSAHDVAHGKPKLTFASYKVLLLSAASTYDSQQGTTRHRGTRHINQAAFSDDVADVSHDIDTDYSHVSHHLDSLELHESQRSRRPFRPAMSKEKWDSLTPDEQKHWDMLSPQAKATILGIGRPPPPRTPRHLNLTDISAADYLHIIEAHEQHHSHGDGIPVITPDVSTPSEPVADSPSADTPGTDLLACATQQSSSAHPGDLRRMLGSNPSGSHRGKTPHEIVVDGKRYRSVNVHSCRSYAVSNHHASKHGSLVDRGANGGLAGNDVRIIHKAADPRLVDVSGIDSHQVNNLPIVTVGGVVPSQRGPVIAIMHQYAYMGTGKTIHSCAQLEWYKNDVNDKSLCVTGGLQRITTNDGYVHPLTIKHGLPYVSIRPFTDHEWDTLPHVVWTSDTDWDPTVLDCSIEEDETWYDAISDLEGGLIHSPFNEFGHYHYHSREAKLHFFDAGEMLAPDLSASLPHSPHEPPDYPALADIIDDIVLHHDEHQQIYSHEHHLQCNERNAQRREPDYELLRPFFLFATANVVKRTFEATTQYARTALGGLHMKQAFRSPFPALNVHRRQEAVATDTLYSDVPAIDNGCKTAQLFVGQRSLVSDVYPMKTEKQFVNTLEDNIHKRGAMDKLISDHAQVEISNRVHDILRANCIDDWQSEPYHQHQNHAEC